jgi:ABC-type polysaccharide/polyol phosphate transport system ATPase subunit
MKELKENGKTMVFVSHSMSTVEQFCDRAIWIHQGLLKMDDDSVTVGEAYLKEQGIK